MSSDFTLLQGWRLVMPVVIGTAIVSFTANVDSRAETTESKFAEQAALLGKIESHYAATVSDDGEISVVSPEEIALRAGSALIEAKDTITVSSGQFKTTLKKGSLALFRMEGTTARCFMLLGTAKVHAGEKVHAAPIAGVEVVLFDHLPDNHELLYRDELGRRNPKTHKVHDNLYLSTSEFSLAQSLDREPLISALAHSREPRDKALKNRLLKMAAVLNMVSAHRGHYGR